MTRTFSAFLVAAFTLTATTAFAGGPVIVDDVEEVVADKPASSMGILPVIVVAVALCAVLCAEDDEPDPCGAAVKC